MDICRKRKRIGGLFGTTAGGFAGMRLFTPCPVTRLLECIGGVSCLFGLVAMATTSQELYASLKTLTTAVKIDKITSKYLNSTRSYQVSRFCTLIFFF